MTNHNFTFHITSERDADDIREVETRAFGFSKEADLLPLCSTMKVLTRAYLCWPNIMEKPLGIFCSPWRRSKGSLTLR